MRWDENRRIYRSLKKDSLREEVENSLRRLKLDVIDLYQIHWPDPEDEIEEGWETLARIKEEGKVRYIGVSNFNVEQMQTGDEDCADHLSTAALFFVGQGGGGGDSALLQGPQHWRD